jgi:6-hydroxycyclohex-1-ene-1-carbonyl-CoA dehydrogenase
VAIDVDDARLARIGEHGASLTLNSATMDFKSMRKAVRSAAAEAGCPPHSWKIFECSGHPDGQQTAFGLLTYASTLMVVGFTLGKVNLRLSNVMAFDATVQGTWGCRPELYPEALRLVIDHEIELKPFIECHPMSQGPDVLKRVADHSLEKRAILEPDWVS